MIIRYKKNMPEEMAAHAFEAFDDIENSLGDAVVERRYGPMVFEKKPTVLTIREHCDEMAADALLGAAAARALQMAKDEEGGVCIRAEVTPGQLKALSPALEALGFAGKSAVLRMARRVRAQDAEAVVPEGLTLVCDHLDDEEERRFYIERLNALFDGGWDAKKLESVRTMPDFTRLLLVDEHGAVGEAITWTERGIGVVDNLWVHPDWRGKGAGKYLVLAVCNLWRERGLKGGYGDIWSRLKGAVRMAQSAGFEPVEAVVEYPYMDVK